MKLFKYKLEITVFISGMVVMILELIGSRILAPYLGNSIFVWTSIIGIILAALSGGYYLGGRLSKNNPQTKHLIKVLLLAAVTIAIIPFLKQFILPVALSLGIKAGSVFATILLFTIPSVILGTISPYAIRLKAKNLENVGGVAGNLYALSTIGSIVGTFLAGFTLIPLLTSSQILYGISIVLVIGALINVVTIKASALLLLLVTALATTGNTQTAYLYEGDSPYNHIRVAEYIDKQTQKVARVMLLATESHSIIFPEEPDLLYSDYSKAYRLDKLFKPNIKRALTIGGGAYVTPRDYLNRFPDAEMVVAELDPKVTEIAKQYFFLEESSRLTTHDLDGRVFLNQNEEMFDVIYGDAYGTYYGVPFQLATQEAFSLMDQQLFDNGVILLNVISSVEGEQSEFLRAQVKTLKQVFPHVYIVPTADKELDEVQNIVVIASKNNQELTKEQLLKSAGEQNKKFIEKMIHHDDYEYQHADVFTDEFAPTDFYASKFL